MTGVNLERNKDTTEIPHSLHPHMLSVLHTHSDVGRVRKGLEKVLLFYPSSPSPRTRRPRGRAWQGTGTVAPGADGTDTHCRALCLGGEGAAT